MSASGRDVRLSDVGFQLEVNSCFRNWLAAAMGRKRLVTSRPIADIARAIAICLKADARLRDRPPVACGRPRSKSSYSLAQQLEFGRKRRRECQPRQSQPTSSMRHNSRRGEVERRRVDSASHLRDLEKLRECLQQRYPERPDIRERLLNAIDDFLRRGLADTQFVNRLCSSSEAEFSQRLTEVLFAHELIRVGEAPKSSRKGPDFLLEKPSARIWIEATCPEPKGVPADWFRVPTTSGSVVSFPHEEMLLRWTAAIKEKAEKLIGGPRDAGYLAKGVVGEKDAYVIAINARRLRGVFPTPEGISRFPFAVEAVFPVGPIQVVIDRDSGKVVSQAHQRRFHIIRSRGEPVPTFTFLDPTFKQISAIWAADFDEESFIRSDRSVLVIHNPQASNPIPRMLLPAQAEYIASPVGNDELELAPMPGKLAAP